VKLLVNGEERSLTVATSVEGLVAELGLEARGLAIAVNGEVVPRSTWSQHRLAEGDQVEVLTVAQGG
jgi:sulfur carrier protein